MISKRKSNWFSSHLSLFRIDYRETRRFGSVIGIGTRIALSGRSWRKSDFTIRRRILKVNIWNHRISKKFFTLAEDSTEIFFSVVNELLMDCVVISLGFCGFMFMSLFLRFTFWPSNCSSLLGVRFRRIFSVFDDFFAEFVVDPKKRNGEVGIGWKSSVSFSVGVDIGFGFGLAKSCWDKF